MTNSQKALLALSSWYDELLIFHYFKELVVTIKTWESYRTFFSIRSKEKKQCIIYQSKRFVTLLSKYCHENIWFYMLCFLQGCHRPCLSGHNYMVGRDSWILKYVMVLTFCLHFHGKQISMEKKPYKMASNYV